MRKTSWMKQSRQENLIYLAVWALLFAAPLLSLYVRTASDVNMTFEWTEVFVVWRRLTIFLLLFLVHNFLLAPLSVHSHRRVAYFTIVAVLIAVFAFFQFSTPPDMKKPMGHRPPPRMETPRVHRPPLDKPRPPSGRHHMPPPVVGEREILPIAMLLLMFGANLGIKAYFRSRDYRQRLAELERQNLEHQLEYLRYQINPHFFMNTLNNIHALVDINPAKAQETIRELSKMMRFVLYEGDKQGIPLTKEMEFIRTYNKLMQLRYSDKVRITLDLPDTLPNRTMPPLLLITFIENAYKHGISYQQESYIETKITIDDDMLHFECRNSKANAPSQEKGGVGLANVRKRLNLLYGHSYTLRIQDSPDNYNVELNIPLS